MYAIIETGGKQYWVKEGERVTVERVDKPEGADISFNALWAGADANENKAPASSKAVVKAKVLSHRRGPKILVFKRRPKKAYKRLHGHRQELSDILITAVSAN